MAEGAWPLSWWSRDPEGAAVDKVLLFLHLALDCRQRRSGPAPDPDRTTAVGLGGGLIGNSGPHREEKSDLRAGVVAAGTGLDNGVASVAVSDSPGTIKWRCCIVVRRIVLVPSLNRMLQNMVHNLTDQAS